jgi:hypothetical protein
MEMVQADSIRLAGTLHQADGLQMFQGARYRAFFIPHQGIEVVGTEQCLTLAVQKHQDVPLADVLDSQRL